MTGGLAIGYDSEWWLEMETITVCIDPETKRRLEQQAHTQGVSLDVWVVETLRRAAQTEWPDAVRRLVGVWGDDFPEPDELRRSLEVESPREPT